MLPRGQLCNVQNRGKSQQHKSLFPVIKSITYAIPIVKHTLCCLWRIIKLFVCFYLVNKSVVLQKNAKR